MQNAKKILVTGGAGFLGSNLCKRLLDVGHYVVAMDNLFTGTKVNILPLMNNPKFSFVYHDITIPLAGQYDEIYNLACPASPIHYQYNPIETMKTSIIGIQNVLNLARDTGAKVLHTSTSEIYGDPLIHPQNEHYWGNVNTIGIRSCYDEGKRCAETLCRDYYVCHDVDVRMVRIFNTYGPNMHPQDGRVISNFIMQALNNENITIYGDGSQTRSFQYCDDLIEAMIRLMDIDYDYLKAFIKMENFDVPVINTGNPDEYTISQLVTEVLKLIPESKSSIINMPLPSDDPKRRKPDITLANKLLNGWKPNVKLVDGLSKTIEYFKRMYFND